jgi:2-dehydro-3-deoxyphosphogluconate aldolase / (4S)-4-hydroxy-2-oxoglutarate aldolase
MAEMIRDRSFGRSAWKDITGMVHNQPFVPIFIFRNLGQVLPTLDAMHSKGINTFEITVRDQTGLGMSEIGLGAIRLARADRPNYVIAAGSLFLPEHVKIAQEAGAMFAVAPGATDEMYYAAQTERMPFTGGIKGSSGAMRVLNWGAEGSKLYGGSRGTEAAYLEVHEPIPGYEMFPSGGINLDNAGTWLGRKGVVFVGGTSLTKRQITENGEVTGVEDLLRRDRLDNEALDVIAENAYQAMNLRLNIVG